MFLLYGFLYFCVRTRCNQETEGNLAIEEEASFIIEDTDLSSSTQIDSGASSGTKRKQKTTEIESEIKDVLEEMKKKYKKDNVDELFLRSILSLMEDFEPKQKDEVRKKIFNLVMEERSKLYD